MSSLLSRMMEFWRSGGTMYNGNRDLYGVFGWNRAPQYRDYLAKYRRQNIARRIIDAPANALWSDPPKVEGDAAFNKAWAELLERIPVFAHLQRLDKLVRLGRYGIMLIGYDDGAVLETPVTQKVGRRVIFMQPYSEASAEIESFEDDQQSPRFGLPKMYSIKAGGSDESGHVLSAAKGLNLGRTFKVHHSRVIHCAEGCLESLVYGTSALEAIYNDLDDLLKVSGGAAETYWLTGNRGLHVDVDKEMELDTEDEEALSEELKEYQHELRRVIRTRGVKINELGTDIADPRGVFEVLLSLISATSGIPKRVLTGSEAGQLASQQDRANWAFRIAERVSEYGAPVVLLPLIRALVASGTIPLPKTLTIEWPDAFKMNPLERAQTSAQMARSAANLSKTMQNIEDLNQSMARAALPQLVNTPMTSSDASGTTPTVNHDSPSANAFPPGAPGATGGGFGGPTMIEAPPLMKKRPVVTFLSEEECRRIIGFGKHAPVFDAEQTSMPPAVKDPVS